MPPMLSSSRISDRETRVWGLSGTVQYSKYSIMVSRQRGQSVPRRRGLAEPPGALTPQRGHGGEARRSTAACLFCVSSPFDNSHIQLVIVDTPTAHDRRGGWMAGNAQR